MTQFLAGLLINVLLAAPSLPLSSGTSALPLAGTTPPAIVADDPAAKIVSAEPSSDDSNSTQALLAADPATKAGWLALIEATKTAPLIDCIRTLDLTGLAARYGDWYPGWPLLTAAPGETLVIRGGQFGRVGLGGGDIIFAACDFSFDGGSQTPAATLYYDIAKDNAAFLRLTLEADTRVQHVSDILATLSTKSAAILLVGRVDIAADIAVFNHGKITSTADGINSSVHTLNNWSNARPLHIQHQIQNSGTIVAGESGIETDNSIYRGSIISRAENSGSIESNGLGMQIIARADYENQDANNAVDILTANTGHITAGLKPRWNNRSTAISVYCAADIDCSNVLCHNSGFIDAFGEGIRVVTSHGSQLQEDGAEKSAVTIIHEGAMFHTKDDLYLRTPLGTDVAIWGKGTGPLGQLRGFWQLESSRMPSSEEIAHEIERLDQQLRLRGLPAGTQLSLRFTYFGQRLFEEIDLASATLIAE